MGYFLIVIGLGIALFGWFKPENMPVWFKIVAVVLLTTCAAVQAFIEYNRIHDERKKARSGTLYPGSSRKKIPEMMKLEIGWTPHESGSFFAFYGELSNIFASQDPTKQNIAQALNDMKFAYDFDDQQLKVSLNLRNKEGNIVASINRNEWMVAQNPRAFDRNYSKDMLEVIDEKGDVVLQVRVLDDVIQLNGVFYDRNGRGVAISPPPPDKPNYVEMKMFPSNVEYRSRLKKLFKYPSELHLGQLVNK